MKGKSTMKNITISMMLTVLIAFSCSTCIHGSRMDILNSQEKEMIKKYHYATSKNSPELTNISDYISSNLTAQSHLGDIQHSLSMMNSIKKRDKKKFEDKLIQLSVYLINSSSVENVRVYRMEKGAQREYAPSYIINGLFHKISSLRTDKSISYLESLIYPVTKWKEPEFSSLIIRYNNPDNDEAHEDMQRAIHGIRSKAMGAIFQPLDSFGKKKLTKVEKIIKSFDEDNPTSKFKTKELLLKRLDTWKKIYSGVIDVSKWRD
jgi:hypothetical protein